jgi:hypothetical protein
MAIEGPAERPETISIIDKRGRVTAVPISDISAGKAWTAPDGGG